MSGQNLEALIGEITREVLQALNRPEASLPAGTGAASTKGKVLLILTSRSALETPALFELLSSKSEQVHAVGAPDVAVDSPASRITGVTSLEQVRNERLLHQASLLLAPALSQQDLYDLVSGKSLRFPLNVMALAWEQGLPVYALREGIQLHSGAEELLQTLGKRGLKILTLADLRGMGSFALPPCQALTDECNACGQCAVKLQGSVEKIVRSGACRVGGTLGMPPVAGSLASYIDHTLLKPDAVRDEVLKLCREAREHSFASVCVNPSWVALSYEELKGSPVKVCTVIGFPLGATTTTTKVMETRDALANGADEIDMVINVGALKAGQHDLVLRDIREVREACPGKILKVILETALLNDEEKVKACVLSKEAGADFVKTSTGFGPGGATVHDVALMRQTVGEEMGVKASGGIRDYETAVKMVEAGATRIGASASVAIVKKASAGAGKY